ncbi:MAG: hypothetical protein R3310_09270, partial [Candidatus Competibacteraceae bacterium]|nr:hypothetical protein [Candidatus Competibacteraceae bacterium]
MADPIQGTLEVRDTSGNTTRITLDPDSADITAGGNGGVGDLILRSPNGTETVRLGRIQEMMADPHSPTPTVIADYIGLRIRDGNGRNTVQIGRRNSTGIGNPVDEMLVVFGAQGSSATLGLVDKNGATRFHLGEVLNQDGQLLVRDAAGREVLRFNSNYAALYLGADGNEGDLIVRDGSGRDVFHLNGSNAALYVGATDNEGDVIVRDGAGRTAVHLNGQDAGLYVG